MATTLQVLCPNGRRQNVKVTPNTKLLQVLEEVCTKQSFLPPDEYDLMHARKALDLTLAFRFSNLLNNAKLELVKAAVPHTQGQGEVIIGLQLEEGQRLQHAFQPSATLWDILEYWESSDESLQGQLIRGETSHQPPCYPVCIYMRDEIIGEAALRDTTLKKLALTSGKAIIRLVYRAIDDATMAEIQNNIDQEHARQTKLQEKVRQQQLEPVGTVSACSQVSSPVDPASPPQRPRLCESAFQVNMDVEETQIVPHGNISPPPICSMDLTEGSSVNRVHFKSGTESSVQKREPELASSEPGAQGSSAIEQLRSLNIPGVEIITPQDFHDLTTEEQQVARALAERYMPGLINTGQQQASAVPRKHKPVPLQSFTDFKFPEETKGKELYRNELSEVKPDEYKPCEREAVVYDSNEENTSKAMTEDLPDEFFEVTDADIKSLYRDLKRQVSTDKPLLTESMRQAELEERHNHYDHIMMRIQFPDGLVLQGCFRPRETVFALYKFVKEHLEDKGQGFNLYRTPPKQVLSDMAKTLVQADLASASLVFFGTDSKDEHHLAASVRREICPKRRADELSVRKLAKKQMESLASGCISGGDPAEKFRANSAAETAKRAPTNRAASLSNRTAEKSDEAQVPKWLKLGGNK